jgi:AcrR family transcriptional regulator
MDGFERRRQQKKEAILNAARELSRQYGYDKISIAEIAKRASVSQVSIYKFFQSKENLRKEMLNKLWTEHYHALINALESNEPIRTKIEQLLLTIVNFVARNSVALMREILQGQTDNTGSLAKSQFTTLQDKIVRLIEQGKHDGTIRSQISTQAIIGYIEVWRFYLLNSNDALMKYENNPELLKEMMDIFLNSLC